MASIAGTSYQPLVTQLQQGDTLLAVTDGLPERLDREDEMMGYSRLTREYRQVAECAIEEIRERLFTEAEEWADGRPRQDDETTLLLRRVD